MSSRKTTPLRNKRISFYQSAKLLRDFALFLFQSGDHSRRDPTDGVNAIPAWNEVLLLVIDEADDLIVPRGLFELLQDFRVRAADVIIDGDRFEVSFDEFDEWSVGEDLGPKVAAASSAGDFLEKQEDWFTGGLGGGEGLAEVTGPLHRADFDRLFLTAIAAGDEEEEDEEKSHMTGSVWGGRYSRQGPFTDRPSGA